MGLFDFLFGKKDENAQNVQSSQARSGASGSRYVVSEGHGIEQCFDPLTFPIREVRVKKMGQVDLAPYDAFFGMRMYQTPNCLLCWLILRN